VDENDDAGQIDEPKVEECPSSTGERVPYGESEPEE
jgi:hypothetical protein